MDSNRRFPAHGYVGLLLVAVFWALNWSMDGLRTHWLFFPLWLGYCLVVDALVVRRKGSSLLTRGAGRYVMLFIISMPGWWLFEVINWRTQNWWYTGSDQITGLRYFIHASINFSTVIPAVFGTAELVGTFAWIKRFNHLRKLAPTRKVTAAMFVIGWAMLAFLLAYPKVGYPFVWGAVFFILEPINVRLGHRSLMAHAARGDWRPVAALCVGCLICGFFWEMWNYYSEPKWIYVTPGAQFWHVFEMPLLGFLGYPPFAMEVYAMYHLLTGLLVPRRRRAMHDYVDAHMADADADGDPLAEAATFRSSA
jgi:hypothetical protein